MSDSAEPVLIRRHGAWWRPNSCGYTSSVAGAGVYDRAFAESVQARAEGVSVVPLSALRQDMLDRRDALRRELALLEGKLELLAPHPPDPAVTPQHGIALR